MTRPPSVFGLLGNFPNPFNAETTIRYHMGRLGEVRISLYNLSGGRGSELERGRKDAGEHEIRFNPQGLSSGVYLVRMRSGTFDETKKILLIK